MQHGLTIAHCPIFFKAFAVGLLVGGKRKNQISEKVMHFIV